MNAPDGVDTCDVPEMIAWMPIDWKVAEWAGVWRLRVPNGWLYVTSYAYLPHTSAVTSTFVPDQAPALSEVAQEAQHE